MGVDIFWNHPIQLCFENGWFQKISIPILQAASRNSEGRGGYVNWNSEDMGGGHWTGIPKAYGGFQKSNFQFGVGKSLQEKLVKNDLSKDDDSLVNTTGGISEFRRGGGLCQLEFQGHGGVTSTGIPRTWGDHWTGIPKAYGGFSEE